MRLRALIAVAALASSVAAAVPEGRSQAPPSPVRQTRVCTAVEPVLYARIGAYGNQVDVSVAADQLDAQRYAWATHDSRRLARDCRRTQLRGTAPRTGLGPRHVIKDGWHLDKSFRCPVGGALTVHVHALDRARPREGSLLSVRERRTGRLVALAELRIGEGWLRVSRRCRER